MKIIKKLKKLIAHEESARAIGNTAEAAAFAEQIQKLLGKYNLSMGEVELHAAEKEVVGIDPVQEQFSNIEMWQRTLLSNIAKINGCYSLEHAMGVQIVVGRQRDRQIVINLFRYFEKLGLELAESYVKDRERAYGAVYVENYSVFTNNYSEKTRRQSFLLGFAATICQRLEEINKKTVEESQNSAALIFLGNREADNKEWMDANLNVEKKDLEPEKDVDRSAFARGSMVAGSVALTDKTLK